MARPTTAGSAAGSIALSLQKPSCPTTSALISLSPGPFTWA